MVPVAVSRKSNSMRSNALVNPGAHIIFRRLWAGGPRQRSYNEATYRLDVQDDADHIAIDAKLPDFGREEIQLVAGQGGLRFTATRKSENRRGFSNHSNEAVARSERIFFLPARLSESRINAVIEKGAFAYGFQRRDKCRKKRKHQHCIGKGKGAEGGCILAPLEGETPDSVGSVSRAGGAKGGCRPTGAAPTAAGPTRRCRCPDHPSSLRSRNTRSRWI